jgi:hypothetical protein
MSTHQGLETERWPGPGGPVEDAIVELVDMVRDAADRLNPAEPQLARDMRVRAATLAVKGVEGLLELTR